jgi:hypothetical protein
MILVSGAAAGSPQRERRRSRRPVLPCYLPVRPLNRENCLPVKSDYLPVKLLFGERSRSLAS